MKLKLSSGTYTKITSEILANDSIISVASTVNFPIINPANNEYFYLDIIDSNGNYETVKVVDIDNSDLAVIRAQGGTIAKSFNINSACGLRINKSVLDDVVYEFTNNLSTISPVISTSLITNSLSFDILNTTATTINAFGAATTLRLGSNTGTTTINNDLIVDGTLTIGSTEALDSSGNLKTKFATARKINGVDFDGSQDISISVASSALNATNSTENSTKYILFANNQTDSASSLTSSFITANPNTGKLTSKIFESTIVTGTSPLVIASTTLIANLNADLLDGQEGSYYSNAANLTGTVNPARLGTGTATNSNYLRGDGSWINLPIFI